MGDFYFSKARIFWKRTSYCQDPETKHSTKLLTWKQPKAHEQFKNKFYHRHNFLINTPLCFNITLKLQGYTFDILPIFQKFNYNKKKLNWQKNPHESYQTCSNLNPSYLWIIYHLKSIQKASCISKAFFSIFPYLKITFLEIDLQNWFSSYMIFFFVSHLSISTKTYSKKKVKHLTK